MTEYERVTTLRRDWAPRASAEVQTLSLINPIEVPVQERSSPTVTVAGVMYQRCRGGRRVLRKRIGGN